jgi:hypothetical protein
MATTPEMAARETTVERRPFQERGGIAFVSRTPFLTATVACCALAALSAAILPTVPSYDPWSWIVWGREVTDPHLSFTVAGGPSWKPLPWLFTTVFGLFGGAAPTLWVIAARAGGTMALVAAFRLAARLVGPQARGWAVFAGLIAAAGVLLTQEWFYYMFRGTSEPLLVGCSLWAIDRHLSGRFRAAFLLGVAASLIRPEAWPFVLLYAGWLWRRECWAWRGLIVAGLVAIPFFWFVPPWIGTGQPFIAASHAKSYNGHLGSDRFLEVLRRGADLQVLPSLILALVAVVLAWSHRGRSGGGDGASDTAGADHLVLWLAAGAVAWWVLVVAMTLDGYPGLERFYLPAAGVTCVLAGVGVVRVAQAAGAAARQVRNVEIPAAGWIVAIALIAISIPFTISRINDARAAKPTADRAVTRLGQLTAAVAAVGGHDGVYPCKSSFAAVNHGVQTALAWKLHVTLERVGTSMRHPGVLFVGPHDSIDGGPAPVSRGLNRQQFVGAVGAWRMYRVWRAGHSTACVGR